MNACVQGQGQASVAGAGDKEEAMWQEVSAFMNQLGDPFLRKASGNPVSDRLGEIWRAGKHAKVASP